MKPMRLSVSFLALIAATHLSGCSGMQMPFFGAQAQATPPAQAQHHALRAHHALQQAGDQAYEAGQFAQAVAYYAMIYQSHQTDFIYRLRYADALRRAGDTTRALFLLEPMADSPHLDGQYYITLAKAYLQAGQASSALDAAHQAVAHAPEKSESLITLGLAYDANHNAEAALGAYQTALMQGAPNTARLLNNIGLAQLRLGQRDAAAISLQNAARLNPQSATVRHNLTWLQETQSVQLADSQAEEPPVQVVEAEDIPASAPVPLRRPALAQTQEIAPVETEAAANLRYLSDTQGQRLEIRLLPASLAQAYATGAQLYLFLPQGLELDEEAQAALLADPVIRISKTQMKSGSRYRLILQSHIRAEITESQQNGAEHSLTIHFRHQPPQTQTSQLP